MRKSLTMRHFSEAFVFLRQLILKTSKQIIKMVCYRLNFPNVKKPSLNLKADQNQLIKTSPGAGFFILLFVIFCSRGFISLLFEYGLTFGLQFFCWVNS